MRIIAIAFACLFASALSLAAKERATILADQIAFERGGNALSAVGNVEVFFQGKLLQASALQYRQGMVTAEGPMTLTDGAGSIIIAKYGQLDDEFKTGVLQGIELLLDDRLQFAGESIEFKDERYVLLRNASVTTCSVCKPGEAPVWHFRSRVVVHDREEHQIYMRDAKFLVGNTHLFTFPMLRIPAPSVRRRSGLLTPRLKFSTARGLTVGTPLYQTLGDHADITLTPFFNSSAKHYIGLEARRRFRRGWIDFNGTLAPPAADNASLSGHAELYGGWDLGGGFELSFSGKKPSDRNYLADYGISSESSARSRVGVSRRTRNTYMQGQTTYITRLDDPSTAGLYPHRIHEVFWRGRTSVPGLGGAAGLNLSAQMYNRRTATADRPLGVSQLTAEGDWKRRWTLPSGLVFSAATGAALDSFGVSSEPTNDFERRIVRFSGVTAFELSYPLIRSRGRTSDLLEPFAQLVWSPVYSGSAIPVGPSQFVEFDATSLRSLDRFSGRDRSEQGLRLNTGVKHSRQVADSYDLELTFGRVLRPRDYGQFTDASGLSGRYSDFVASADVSFSGGMGLRQSWVMDEELDVSKGSTQLSYDNTLYAVAIGYSHQEQDEAEGMSDDINSLTAGLKVGLHGDWSAISDLSLDLDRKADSRVEFGVVYSHQCLDFSAKFERTLRTMSDPDPSSKFSMTFSLGGFSDPGRSEPAACTG